MIMMHVKPRIAATMLSLMAVIAVLALANVNTSLSASGAQVDLFTQKEPFSGRGGNVSSDAFAPGELVQISALATYNGYPVQSLLVGFQVSGPASPGQNIAFCRTALTSEEGIASFSFRVPYTNESGFGVWTVIGNVRIGDDSVQGTVTFRVGWIVEIVSVKTVNEAHDPQQEFTRGGSVGVEVVLKSIAMTDKEITITLAVYDALNIRVSSAEIAAFTVRPNEAQEFAYANMSLPENATVGNAVVQADVYVYSLGQADLPCCPEASANFAIVESKLIHDVAVVGVAPSTYFAYTNETVSIHVAVTNLGDYAESFGVKILFGLELAGTMTVDSLAPKGGTVLVFNWKLETVAEGNYTISAQAMPVPDEANVQNNLYADGTLQVAKAPGTAYAPDWFSWFLIFLGALAALLIALVLGLLYRRRKKRAEGAFLQGWTAWYYCYDLRRK